MSKRKGLSFEEKRQRLCEIFYESVFNLIALACAHIVAIDAYLRVEGLLSVEGTGKDCAQNQGNR